MLCASDSPISAQNSEHNASGSSITQTSSLIHDPYDPRIDREYEILVHRWNRQLLQHSREFVSSLENPVIATKDAKVPPPLATMDTNEHQQWLMDMERFFEELWLDAQHMLQCAQAWNYSSSLSSSTRANADALSLNDVIRSMNIFGLRIMQRSLYARQTLLNSHRRQQAPASDATTTTSTTIKASKNNNSYATMAVSPLLALWKSSTEVTGPSRGIKVPHDKEDADQKRTIPAGSSTSLYTIPAEEEDEDDQQEMNAPLLRRTRQQEPASNCSCTSISCSCDDKSRQQSTKYAMQETMTTSSWVSLLPYPPVRQSTPCLPSIAGTTAAATATAGDGPSPTTTQRQHPPSASSKAANARPPQMPSNRSAYGRRVLSSSRKQYPCQSVDALSTSRSCSTGIVDEDGLWESWFGDNNCGANNDSRPLHAITDTSHTISSGDYGGSNKHISQTVDDDDDDTVYLTAAYHRGLSDDDNESITSTKRRPAAAAAAAASMAAAPCLPIDEKTEIESPAQEVRLHRFHQNSSSRNSGKDVVASSLIEPLSSLKMTRSCDFMSAMVRSESSISAFRPISKTLAPDYCPREISIAEDERPSRSSLDLEIKPIPKSKSFPSKVAAFGVPTRETFSAYPLGLSRSKDLPHPINSGLDNKERNFVMRSIVGKKASLTRLFSAKK